MTTRLYVQIGDRERQVEIDAADGALAVRLDGEPVAAEWRHLGDGQTYALRLGDRVWEIMAAPAEGGWELLADGHRALAAVLDERERRVAEAGPRGGRAGGRSEIRAPMPGLVVCVAVAPGEAVTAGARLLSLEAMKMENEIRASAPGTVAEVRVAAGQTVEQGQVLVVIE